MTLCAAVIVKDQGILLVSDSIVTARLSPATAKFLVNQDGKVIEAVPDVTGITSKGEYFQPQVNQEVTYCSEGACKIGQIGPDVFAAFAGEEAFAVRLCEEFSTVHRWIQTNETEQLIQDAAERVISTHSHLVGSKVALILCGKSANSLPMLLRAEIQSELSGSVACRFRGYELGEVCTIGSGAVELSDLQKLASGFYTTKPIPQSLCLMTNYFSRQLRMRLRNEALGVGGAYFGAAVALAPGSSGLMPDLLEIYISEAHKVRVLTKTICRDGVFWVHDYMKDLTGAYPLVNHPLRSCQNEIFKNFPHIRRADLMHLNSQCLIIENDADDLGIPKGPLTFFDPSGFKRMVGWAQSTSGKSKLAVSFGEQWLLLERE